MDSPQVVNRVELVAGSHSARSVPLAVLLSAAVSISGCGWMEPDRVAGKAAELSGKIEAARSSSSDRVPYRSLRQSANPYLALKPVVREEARLPEDLAGEFGITLGLLDRPSEEVLAGRLAEAAGISVKLVGQRLAASEGKKNETRENGAAGSGSEWLSALTDEYSSEGGVCAVLRLAG